MVRLPLAVACTGVLLAAATYLGCGDSDSDATAPPDASASSSGSTSSGGSSGGSSGASSSSGGSSGGSSGSSGEAGADGGRVVYPPGAGTATVVDGGLACTAGNWTRSSLAGTTVPVATPLAAATRGDELFALLHHGSAVVWAKRDAAGTWTTETGPTIPGSSTKPFRASLTLDATGGAHAVFAAYSSRDVTYAARSGANAWTTRAVVSRQALDTSVAIAPDGTAYVAVDGLGNGSGDVDAFRALPDGGGWAKEIAAPAYLSIVGTGPELRIAPAGTILCYAGATSFQVGIGCVERRYPTEDGGVAWDSVVSMPRSGATYGAPSFAVAGDGALSLAWLGAGFSSGSTPFYELYRAAFAALADGGLAPGSSDLLDTSTGVELGAPRLFRDAAGDVHIGYRQADAKSSALKYIRIRPDGSATGAIVACDVEAWQMAMTNKEGPVFLYTTATPPRTLTLAHP